MKTSLDHLPESKQRELEEIVAVIRDEFEQVTGFANGKKKHCRILKIILFGSYATGRWVHSRRHNGYLSDYDILVVLNNDELLEEHSIWNTIESRLMVRVKPPVTVIPHTLHQVNSALAEGQYFFSDIKKEGIVLHQLDDRELASPASLSPAEAKEIAGRYYRQWIKAGDEFLDLSRYCLEKDQLLRGVFLLHQAAESFFTCIMLVFTNYKPNTHNLTHLNNLTISQDERLTEAFPQDTRLARNRFQLLKRAYVESRYSEHYEITEEQLDWLIGRVEVLQTLTKQLCEERIG